jgi:hypothetical protein
MAPGWLSDVLHVVLGGAIGSSVAFGLSWLREHRRTTDAYRAPQRQAIGELIAAAHELQLRILNFRADLSDLIDDMRQDRTDDLGSLDVRLRQSRLSTPNVGTLWRRWPPCSHGSPTSPQRLSTSFGTLTPNKNTTI